MEDKRYYLNKTGQQIDAILESVDNLIVVSDKQPTMVGNRIWVKENSNEVEILTADDLFRFDVVIPTNWQGVEAPYTQEVLVPGLDGNDVWVDLKNGDNFELIESELEAYSNIYKIETFIGKIKLYALNKIEIPLTLKIRGGKING